jgi:hypothetical protein
MKTKEKYLQIGRLENSKYKFFKRIHVYLQKGKTHIERVME